MRRIASRIIKPALVCDCWKYDESKQMHAKSQNATARILFGSRFGWVEPEWRLSTEEQVWSDSLMWHCIICKVYSVQNTRQVHTMCQPRAHKVRMTICLVNLCFRFCIATTWGCFSEKTETYKLSILGIEIKIEEIGCDKATEMENWRTRMWREVTENVREKMRLDVCNSWLNISKIIQ